MVIIAYIILAYRLPAQLIRLVNQLDYEGATFHIHIDKKTKSEVFNEIFSELNWRSNVFFIPRHHTPWGRIGCVKAELAGIKQIVESNIDFDFTVNLSGQDYPIKSNQQIQDTLQSGIGFSFLRYYPIPYEGHPQMQEWILYRHYYFLRWHISFPKADIFETPWLNRLWNPLVARHKASYPLPSDMLPFYGSAYWCLSKEAALYIYNYLEKHKDYLKRFSHVQFPDEFFFQTTLLNSFLKDKIVDENYRFIDFSSKKAHPNVMLSDDLPRLFSSPKLFARKFDMTVDNRVLDLIDERIK